MAKPASTQLRVPKALNDRLKPYADVLECSIADLAAKALTTICDMMDGDERPPLLVEEYKLKLRYKQTESKKK